MERKALMFGGPVLLLELLLGSRRGKQYLFRYLYVAWIVLQFGALYLSYWFSMRLGLWGQNTADFAANYVQVFLTQQYVLMLLAIPAFTAGAITDEKQRGTLQYMLAADLTATEIVFGKLLGRLLLALSLFLGGLPVLVFVACFAGITLPLLLAIIVQMLLIAFGIAAGSILASVLVRHTREAILGLYAVLALLLGAAILLRAYVTSPAFAAGSALSGLDQTLSWLNAFLRNFDPQFALEPLWEGDISATLTGRLFWFCIAWAAAGSLCILLAAWRLRRSFIRQLEGMGKIKKALLWIARPTVTDEPIRWKERHVVGLAPFGWMRFFPTWAGMGIIFIMTTAIAFMAADTAGAGDFLWRLVTLDFARVGQSFLTIRADLAREFVTYGGLVTLIIASLVVGVRCSGAITGEREKHTWEALLLTPLETPQLVRAKLWGIIGSTYPYLLMYALPMFLFSFLGGVGGVFSFFVSIGVIWMAMYYVGAAGIWCSARSKNSWRSLIGLFGWGYLGGALLWALLSPLLWLAYVFILLMIMLIRSSIAGQWTPGGPTPTFEAFSTAMAIFMAVAFMLGAWFFLKEAEKRVADYDRMRHWKSERKRRPRRRPPPFAAPVYPQP